MEEWRERGRGVEGKREGGSELRHNAYNKQKHISKK